MNDILIIRQPHTEYEFEAMYNLRWRILFKPWDQPRGCELDDLENDAISFIALLDDAIIGTARFHKINDRIGQIKFFAVDYEFQNKGIGSNIVYSIHMSAKNQGIKYIILNARENSINFFKKHGYELVGEGPALFGSIKLFKMKNILFKSRIR
ncbi:MAG: GNAT family N-acetyltransferase [Candidatus Helarchaeota archaeon]